MRLSLGNAWDEAKAVLRRDGRALVAIVLALLVLPGAVAELATPNVSPGQSAPNGWWDLLNILAMLLSLTGQIAITRIALGFEGTVGEAIAVGFRRLPALLGALLLWVLPFALIVVAILLATGADLSGEIKPQPVAGLALLPVLLVFFYILFRLLLVTPVVTAEPVGPVAALKRSWKLTGGHWGKLFLAVLLIALVATIVIGALQFAIGTVILFAAGTPDQWSVSDLLLTLVGQLLGGAFSLVFAAIVASFYRQLAVAPEAHPSVPDAGHR